MKPLLICLVACTLAISGCLTTSQTTKDVAGTVIDAAGIMHQQHINTIDAYIKSLEAARDDTNTLFNVIKNDSVQARALKKQILELTAQAMTGDALLKYQNKVQQQIFSGLDQRIEDEFWPPVVAKQNVYRSQADALGDVVKSHTCATSPQGCGAIAMADYQKINKEYRDYSVAAEYIIHLGYKKETEIWQQAVESFEEQKINLESKLSNFIAKQDLQLNISTEALAQELKQVASNFDNTIAQLEKDKTIAAQHWASTERSLKVLQSELSKPAIWESILSGMSDQAKTLLTSYSGTINQAVSGVFGQDIGNLVSNSFVDQVEGIIDIGVGNISSTVGSAIKDAQTVLNKEAEQFNTTNNINVRL